MIVREHSAAHAVDWTALRVQALQKALEANVNGEIRFDPGARVLYSTDASIYQIPPLGVVVPRTVDALAATAAIAAEQRIPIVPRGAGTSLSGQAIGPGLVIDCSKYLDRVVDLDLTQRTVRVQPGCVLAHLNQRLKPHGFLFGPDVATIDRANIGGMIGNNSSGARSIRYDKTIDHVRALDVVLSDGARRQFSPIDAATLRQKFALADREGEIYRSVHRVITECEDEIRRRYPKVFRRVSGYNLDALLPPAPMDLSKLIVGSEGTLAVVAEAVLNIVPLPSSRGIAVIEFDSLTDAMESLMPILATDPSAVELLDELILDLARANREYARLIDFLAGEPQALFIVEYLADDPGEIERSFANLREALASCRKRSLQTTVDPHGCERIWNARKMALPLLLAMPGATKPVTFVEDTAVSPEKLGEYVQRFRAILTRHGTDGSFYGHASVGCLHIRPLLDLSSSAGVRTMETIANEVVDLVREFGGAMSGEHGDGLARSCFNPTLFGPTVYAAFCRIKRAFDPENLFNPGKITDAQAMTANLREVSSIGIHDQTGYNYTEPGSMLDIVAECNGNGLCRRQQKGVMCPSYMATREERDSPRGRANILRAALEGELPGDSWSGPDVNQALDLCLMCKACKTECPSSVDIARLKSESLHRLHQDHPPTLFEDMSAHLFRYSPMACDWAPLSNLVMRNWLVRRWIYPLLGIDPRRKLPPFRRNTLVRWFKQHKHFATKPVVQHVVLLADCFTNYHEPHVGRAAVILLELAGYQVHLAPICCGRTLISKGFLDEARDLVGANLLRLAPHIEEGRPVLGIEPSCLFTLTDEWLDLDFSGMAKQVAAQSLLLETWLARETVKDPTLLPVTQAEPVDVLFHAHCHQRSAGAVEGTVEALRRLANVSPIVLDSGCCGMAGSFGYEANHYQVSVDVAEQRLLPAIREAPNLSIIAPGFSCRSQIHDLSGRSALHPVEIIRRRVGIAGPTR